MDSTNTQFYDGYTAAPSISMPHARVTQQESPSADESRPAQLAYLQPDESRHQPPHTAVDGRAKTLCREIRGL
jgi:hypothetical protein